MSPAPVDPDEERARNRYMLMNGARVGGLALLLIGLMGTRNVLPLPYPLAVVMAVGGMLGFFFIPPLLAKRWKSGDGEP